MGTNPKATGEGLGYRVAEGARHAHFNHLVSKRRVGARQRKREEELLLKDVSVLV
jgi:hypothetical protein